MSNVERKVGSHSTDERISRALELLKAGDTTAKNDLLVYAQGQLERMVRAKLHQVQFEVVRRWEQTDDVLQGTLLRLSKTIDRIEIATPRDFFKLAATNIRWELKTLLDKHIAAKAGAQRHQSDVDHGAGPETGAAGGIIAGAMAAPNAFEELSRFLDEIGKLSDEDREMIDLIVVYGLTNQEAADTLGMSLSTFRRRYRDACCRLGELLDQDRR